MKTTYDNPFNLKDMAEEGYESARQLGEINLNIWNKMIEKQTDTFGRWLDAGTKQMKLVTSSKSYSDYLDSQAQLSRELSESLQAEGRESVKTAGEVRDAYRSWLETATGKLATRTQEKTTPAQQ